METLKDIAAGVMISTAMMVIGILVIALLATYR